MALHGGEHPEKFVERVMVVEVVEQRLRGYPRAPEDERASHEFGIGLHRTVIERQHSENSRVSEWSVNAGLGAGRAQG